MAVSAAHSEAELIDTVCAQVRARLPDEQGIPCESFVRQYYHRVPAEDLAARDPLDLCGVAVAHWNLAHQRGPGQAKVHVHNPDFLQHGWRSPHTVIEIVTDDMPFLVDSVTMELSRQGHSIDLMIHPVIRVRRNRRGVLREVLEPLAAGDGVIAEWIMHAEVVHETDAARLRELGDGLERALGEVRRVVEDSEAMRRRAVALIDELERQPPPVDDVERQAVQAFLAWLADGHFTFLGSRLYDLVLENGEAGLNAIPDSGLGILRGTPAQPYTSLRPNTLAIARGRHPLVLTKANSRATVHRPAYLDYIGVKRFGLDGAVVGETRFLGLYTSAAYKERAVEIPGLSGKVRAVLSRAAFPPGSHEETVLTEIIESYPRDSLFHVRTDELFALTMGLWGLGERQRVRLFVCRDRLERFVECLVTIPRDRYHTDNRERVQRILLEAFGGVLLDWRAQLSDSLLVRVYFRVRCPHGIPPEFNAGEIEARLVKATRAWSDDLRDALIEEHGEEHGSDLHKRYDQAFPAGYRSDWIARSAVADITRIEQLASGDEPIIDLYRPVEAPEGAVRCKLFSSSGVSLSNVLPTFEHMGAHVLDERPYEISPRDRAPAWIYDFTLNVAVPDAERARDNFQEAFLGIWRGELEDDGLGGLVLTAGLTGREITVLRAIAKYLRQAGTLFSSAYMVRTLLAYPDIAAMLLGLFVARFDPERRDDPTAHQISGELKQAIDAVESLDEDRILRSFLDVVRAIVRTNFFLVGGDGHAAPYLSFKLDPSVVSLLPPPRPRFEIFVYSPRVEGIHLRGGRVARGGLRWSDRPEDFRTEILGLMKAQMVKNALIVPVGAKGGFVVKRPPSEGGREALLEEAVGCYQDFLSGLLDVTDNIVGGETVVADQVVAYDEGDPYLVVAADKGTASFSDIANEVSARSGFWLGDAFASGGSNGYDHKQMGITARGAWESVKRHFREVGIDAQTTDFTAVGIGDMSGDVFGNGMLLSPHIKLLAAFNHAHVFLDPDPDPEASFAERKRLFALPRSSWSDYDESLISEGGGVHPRSAKSIRISEQVKDALAIDADALAPNDLIREILSAPVDLLWNGGIGTYVKGSSETHADVGDKANDAVRLDAERLRCRVVGEGGNLGFTQRGRIEYALGGGRINTDAIDNVAGVNCSDHEVNIKILLDSVVAGGDMTPKQRSELLVAMTDAVAEKVRYGSYTQTQALSLAVAQAAAMVDVHARLIADLEQVAGLNREIEFLPTDEAINDRKLNRQGLVAPELAVLMAHCKIHLYDRLLDSDLPEDEYLGHDLERYFPAPLAERFAERMRAHRLRREIIATVVANQLVDRAGTTFVFRLSEETGASPALLARAYAAAREILDLPSFWSAVEALDNQVEAQSQLKMLIEGRRLAERATRWLVTAYPEHIDIAQTIDSFEHGAGMLRAALPDILDGTDRAAYERWVNELRDAGVPASLAAHVAGMPCMIALFDIVEAARISNRQPDEVMTVHFRLGSRIELNWLRDRIIDLPRTDVWEALARTAMLDELYSLHRLLTQEALEVGGPGRGCEAAIEAWEQRNQRTLERYLAILNSIKASRSYNTTTLPVALREVRNLIRGVAGTGAQAPRTCPPSHGQLSAPSRH
jgi:glutamate dehydrogenase